MMGVSRSATVVAAYILASSDTPMSGDDAVEFVRKKRDQIYPNEGFRRQLNLYALQYFTPTSIPLSAENAVVTRAQFRRQMSSVFVASDITDIHVSVSSSSSTSGTPAQAGPSCSPT